MKCKSSSIIILFCCIAVVSKAQSNVSYGEEMAKTVMTLWKDSLAHTWTYEQGVVYGGFEALWRNTGNANYFNLRKEEHRLLCN